METKTVYFDTPGPQNTAEVLQLAHARAETLGVRSVVVASYSGVTGAQAAQLFGEHNLVVVGGVYGFKELNQVRMQEEQRALIEAQGGRLLFTGHAFGMMGRAANRRFGGIQVDEIVANVLRLLSQGVKVACEITCMATDAGLIQAGEEVIAIGGTSTGADSAIVVRASNTHTFFDTRILEIICKPRG
jgi:hypothetical protein